MGERTCRVGEVRQQNLQPPVHPMNLNKQERRSTKPRARSFLATASPILGWIAASSTVASAQDLDLGVTPAEHVIELVPCNRSSQHMFEHQSFSRKARQRRRSRSYFELLQRRERANGAEQWMGTSDTPHWRSMARPHPAPSFSRSIRLSARGTSMVTAHSRQPPSAPSRASSDLCVHPRTRYSIATTAGSSTRSMSTRRG